MFVFANIHWYFREYVPKLSIFTCLYLIDQGDEAQNGNPIPTWYGFECPQRVPGYVYSHPSLS